MTTLYHYRRLRYKLERRYRRIVGPPPGTAVRIALMSPAELLAERNRINSEWVRWQAHVDDYQFVKYDLLIPPGFTLADGRLMRRSRDGGLVDIPNWGFDQIDFKWPASARA